MNPHKTHGSDEIVREEDLPEPPSQAKPWAEWSWFRWQPGEFPTFFWIVLIHVAAVVGLVLFPTPGWTVFGIAFVLAFLGGFGTTVGYHRALAHKAVRLKKPS